MFQSNKYTNWYLGIVESARNRTGLILKESHHVIPKCMGGTDDPENLVDLTPREHFVCHLLLTKMVFEPAFRSKLAYAAWQQSRGKEINSKTYAYLRGNLSATYTGRTRPAFSDEWRANMAKAKIGKKTRPHTEETKKQISENRKGKSDGAENHFFGKTHSDESKAKMATACRERMTGVAKKKYECPHCQKSIAPNMFYRYHGDNCKLKPI